MLNFDADETARLIDHLAGYSVRLRRRIERDHYNGPERRAAARQLEINDRWIERLRGELLQMPSPAVEAKTTARESREWSRMNAGTPASKL